MRAQTGLWEWEKLVNYTLSLKPQAENKATLGPDIEEAPKNVGTT